MRCDDTDEERAEAWSSLFVDFGNDHGPLIEAWDGRMGMAVIDCLCDVRIPCFLPMLLTHMPFLFLQLHSKRIHVPTTTPTRLTVMVLKRPRRPSTSTPKAWTPSS